MDFPSAVTVQIRNRVFRTPSSEATPAAPSRAYAFAASIPNERIAPRPRIVDGAHESGQRISIPTKSTMRRHVEANQNHKKMRRNSRPTAYVLFAARDTTV